MQVTISIINYNYGRYLKHAVESALTQNGVQNFIEVLLIDDGSTDESDVVAAKFKKHNNFRVSKTENRGFAASLTRAVLEAKGEYVFFLDADDYFAPNKVAAMLPLLQQGYFYVSDTPSSVNKFGAPVSGGASGSTSTIAVYKPAVMKLLPVENELAFHTLYKIGKGISIKDSYTFYRWHDKNMTDRKVPGKWQSYLATMTNNLGDKLIKISADHDLPPWDVTQARILRVGYEFKSLACYNQLEAALELRQVFKAYRNCFFMFYWNLRAGKFIPVLHLKMIVKTVILRPSFPK